MGQVSAAFTFTVEALQQFQLNRHLTTSLIASLALLGLAEAAIHRQTIVDDADVIIDLNQR